MNRPDFVDFDNGGICFFICSPGPDAQLSPAASLFPAHSKAKIKTAERRLYLFCAVYAAIK